MYTPTASNITLQLTQKSGRADFLDSSGTSRLTVLSLANITSSTAETRGNEYIPNFGQKNSTFTFFDSYSNIDFMMTASDPLPIYAVTDVLRGMQELTHYLYFLEMTFEVFSGPSTAYPAIASGCLARDCGSRYQLLRTRGLEYANLSATNISAAPSRRLQPTIAPIQLNTWDQLESIAVTYDELSKPLAIDEQSFADVADRMLATITDLIIAVHSDGLLPIQSNGKHLVKDVDAWGSTLGISLLPLDLLGTSLTLGQAAMALKAIQNRLSDGILVESLLKITVDGSMVGWGCLRYTNTSAWRCLMPSSWSGSTVGSCKELS